jgi:hypothetical protein
MLKAIALLIVTLVGVLTVAAQSPEDKLPTVTTQGTTNPEAISDLNAQLIWLLGAAPGPQDSSNETAARAAYRQTAFGKMDTGTREKLDGLLREFRVRHDALAAEYNARIPSVQREDVWVVYRDFRVKVNDLVAETVRTLYAALPDGGSRWHSTIQETKRTIYLSAYRSSADPEYASNPRTASTGFTYIQGAVSGGGHFLTAVIVGMVPGCPGKVYPTVVIGGASAEGPLLHPREYMNFQRTQASAPDNYGIAVQCAIPTQP